MNTRERHISDRQLGRSLIISLGFHILTAAISVVFLKDVIPVFRNKPAAAVEIVLSRTSEAVRQEEEAITEESKAGKEESFSPPDEMIHSLGNLQTPLLPDAEPLDYKAGTQLNPVFPSSGNHTGSGTGNSDKGIYNSSSLPFTPRQIVEVMPRKTENKAEGLISLSLLIGYDGSVKEHKVIANTIKNPEILQSVITAAYKSRWQKVSLKGNAVQYWTEKSYIFN